MFRKKLQTLNENIAFKGHGPCNQNSAACVADEYLFVKVRGECGCQDIRQAASCGKKAQLILDAAAGRTIRFARKTERRGRKPEPQDIVGQQ